jgi:hypothetical protein
MDYLEEKHPTTATQKASKKMKPSSTTIIIKIIKQKRGNVNYGDLELES